MRRQLKTLDSGSNPGVAIVGFAVYLSLPPLRTTTRNVDVPHRHARSLLNGRPASYLSPDVYPVKVTENVRLVVFRCHIHPVCSVINILGFNHQLQRCQSGRGRVVVGKQGAQRYYFSPIRNPEYLTRRRGFHQSRGLSIATPGFDPESRVFNWADEKSNKRLWTPVATGVAVRPPAQQTAGVASGGGAGDSNAASWHRLICHPWRLDFGDQAGMTMLRAGA